MQHLVLLSHLAGFEGLECVSPPDGLFKLSQTPKVLKIVRSLGGVATVSPPRRHTCVFE